MYATQHGVKIQKYHTDNGLFRANKWVHDCVKNDQENGNQLWQQAAEQKMSNIATAFEILEEGKALPVGRTKCVIKYELK